VVPYASITFHRSYAFLSWDYLYLVLCAFALFAGALFERGMRARTGLVRVFVAACAILLVGWYGTSFAWVNLESRTARDYWAHVLSVNPESDIATLERGRALLAEGDREAALRQLFPPRRVEAVWRRSLLMAHHYALTGELTAAAVHFNQATQADIRDLCVANRIQWVGAEIVYAAGALDYAEQGLTMILMANRYDTAAMRRLGEVLARKGRVSAGLMFLEEARRIDPADTETLKVLERIHTRIAHPEADTPERIRPPGPGWLRYLMGGHIDAEVSADIIGTSDRIPDDPLLQAKAGECLLALGEPGRARVKLTLALRTMPGDPFVEAMKRRADEAASPDALP
jgi:tetratricopeptide (TPR) repeat protein